MREGHQTLRRIEVAHVALAAVWGCGMTIAILGNAASGAGVVTSLVALTLDGLIFLYLIAPAASVRVTRHRVIVNNPYVRHIVPRHLVQGIRTEGFWTARLLVDGGRAVRLVALNLNLPRGYASYPSHRQAQLVMRVIAEVPQEASTGDVQRRMRYGNIALATAAGGTAIAAALYLLTVRQ
jgi:hypothetical protein